MNNHKKRLEALNKRLDDLKISKKPSSYSEVSEKRSNSFSVPVSMPALPRSRTVRILALVFLALLLMFWIQPKITGLVFFEKTQQVFLNHTYNESGVELLDLKGVP